LRSEPTCETLRGLELPQAIQGQARPARSLRAQSAGQAAAQNPPQPSKEDSRTDGPRRRCRYGCDPSGQAPRVLSQLRLRPGGRRCSHPQRASQAIEPGWTLTTTVLPASPTTTPSAGCTGKARLEPQTNPSHAMSAFDPKRTRPTGAAIGDLALRFFTSSSQSLQFLIRFQPPRLCGL